MSRCHPSISILQFHIDRLPGSVSNNEGKREAQEALDALADLVALPETDASTAETEEFLAEARAKGGFCV